MTNRALMATTLAIGLTACPAGDDATTAATGTESASTTDATDGQSATSSDPTGQTTAQTSGSASGTDGGSSDGSASATTTATTTGASTDDAGSTGAGSTGDGSATSDGGSTGDGPCCDPEQEPICFEGATCCSDGMWECNTGLGMAPCDEGPVCGGGDGGDEGGNEGGMCAGPQQSCAQGELCCEGLMCCSGVPVPQGQEFCGQVCPISDRNKKQNFRAVDPQEVLRKVAAMPISTWNYKAQPAAIRHMGPMAQDFKATFGLGSTDKAIFTIDADGVALAAIQGLHAELESLRRENRALHDNVQQLQQRLDRLESK